MNVKTMRRHGNYVNPGGQRNNETIQIVLLIFVANQITLSYWTAHIHFSKFWTVTRGRTKRVICFFPENACHNILGYIISRMSTFYGHKCPPAGF
jgi:hypothetical protein